MALTISSISHPNSLTPPQPPRQTSLGDHGLQHVTSNLLLKYFLTRQVQTLCELGQTLPSNVLLGSRSGASFFYQKAAATSPRVVAVHHVTCRRTVTWIKSEQIYGTSMFVREQVTGNATVQKKKETRRPLHVGSLEWCSCWQKRTGTTTRCEQTFALVDSFLQPVHPVCCCVFSLFERVFLGRLPPPSLALCFRVGPLRRHKEAPFLSAS